MPKAAAPVAPVTPEGLSPVALTPPPVEEVAADPPAPTVLLSAIPEPQAAAPAPPVEPVAAVTQPGVTLPVFPADPALQSLLQQLCTTQRTGGQQFHLLYIPADGSPQVETFDTCPALVQRMIELLGQPCFLYAFLGHYLPMTPGPLRHLRTPFGFMPLFTIPNPEAIGAVDGWAGSSPRPEVRPAQIEVENEEPAPGELNVRDIAVDAGPPPPVATIPHPSVTAHDTPMFPGAEPVGR